MNELLSEFFYEAVRRIVPGLAAIIVFFRDEVAECYHHQFFVTSPHLFAACVIAVSWLFGLLVETNSWLLIRFFYWLITNCRPESSWLRRKFKNLVEHPAGHLPCLPNLPVEHPATKEITISRERQRLLNIATKIMCRCLAIIFFFGSLDKINWHQINWGQFWQQLNGNYLSLTALFFFAWLGLKNEVEHSEKS